MTRVLCAAALLVFTACTAPTRYIPAKPGPVLLAVAPGDTAAVRQLCVAPEKVVAGEEACVLKGTEGKAKATVAGTTLVMH